MPRSSRRSPSPPGTSRRSPSPGTRFSSLSPGSSRRSFHGSPPSRSSGNPNPQYPLPAVPPALSGSSRRSFPGCPPTRSSRNIKPQDTDPIVSSRMYGSSRRSPIVPATMHGSSRRSFAGHPPPRSSRKIEPQDPLPAVSARMSRSSRGSPIAPATMSRSSRCSPIAPATISGSSRRPFAGNACALVDSYGYVFLASDVNDATGYGLVAGDDNNTTALTFTTATGTIKVTFIIADLPCLSYFYIRCVDLSASPFDSEPEIVWSTENLVLISLDISTCRSPEYFIYRAGLHGRRPSLDPLPDMSTYFAMWNIDPHLVGVLPDGGGTDFVLAAFTWESGQYKLHIFRSKQHAWTVELLVPDFPCWLTQKRRLVSPEKVIALKGGFLGFVDLWKGILLCNVLKEPVTVDFIPLPKLLPTNREHYNESLARPIRDVTCLDGLIIRCVELEDIYSIKTSIPDASTKDLFFDSEAVDPTDEGVVEEFAGWRLITWFRDISWNFWRKGSVAYMDELRTVSMSHPDYSSDRAAKSRLKTLETFCPTVCGDDIVCLMSKNNPRGHDACILTVDTRSKIVGEPVPFHAKRSRHSNTTYIPCTLNKYLNNESDTAQVGLQNARSDGHFSLELPQQNSNTSRQKRQRLVLPYDSRGLVHV